MKCLDELHLAHRAYEMFLMPDVRIIGKAYRCTFDPDATPWLKFWDEYNAIKPTISALPKLFEGGMICWTGDSCAGSDHYTYMPSVVCPAGTPVPEGLDYRDLPASYVAKGEYGDDIDAVVGKFMLNGFVTCYTDLGWNAELYTDAEQMNPTALDEGLRWLVPCILR